jgi:hypothetical protein
MASMTVSGRAVSDASVRCLTEDPSRYDWRSRTETYSFSLWTRRTLATCIAPLARFGMRESSHKPAECQVPVWLQSDGLNDQIPTNLNTKPGGSAGNGAGSSG